MIGWSGRRKALALFFFLGPTILGITLFSLYPILLSTFVSFTNRNKFRPNPDCSLFPTSIIDPLCWPAFRDRIPQGLGSPYRLQEPLFGNYALVLGNLFTPTTLGAIAMIAACFVPLAAAAFFSGRFEKLASPPVPSSWLWLGALVLGLIMALALNVSAAYSTLLSGGDFIVVVLRTFIFVIARVPASFVLGLTLALILNSPNLPGRTFFRIVLFIPWAASSLAILMSLVWQFFFREQGTINQILAAFGVPGKAWLNDPFWAFVVVVIVDTWFSYPFFMVTILGALQSVPGDVYEAADLDGASWWTQLTQITLPLIRPAILPATVLTSISAFQMFGTVWAITKGGPIEKVGQPGATEFVIVYAFKQIFQSQNYGQATAFAVILFIFLFSLTLYSLRLTNITKGAYDT
ncbi:sugar ABC transporter permease [Chloroflexales bacterium ZM16-3]|nr:sugar ABC transporter permease [Chloroflexales bacterium ZM16-3]